VYKVFTSLFVYSLFSVTNSNGVNLARVAQSEERLYCIACMIAIYLKLGVGASL
jgi:hypothetical protein